VLSDINIFICYYIQNRTQQGRERSRCYYIITTCWMLYRYNVSCLTDECTIQEAQLSQSQRPHDASRH